MQAVAEVDREMLPVLEGQEEGERDWLVHLLWLCDMETEGDPVRQTVAVAEREGLVEVEGQGEGEREGLVQAVEVPEREGETLAD